ncbi:SGNH/GDSL hydrolase family protein [Streptomyces sp. TLI_171]|uniref:SGNH/GDSL hydrolase family protein n=1 Tax=Streptomyces sp. TLI_171 TaxID=1938859 RepID=UPI000C1755D6|nr:SGNH/GDSL hydrolase family protein [Streptomyces sp. TLI_171]RKE18991.1 GDSL-like lipase/acylhydrolase family protein [Streptomyces sp. TLI_171]
MRRRLLAATAAALVGLAGCSGAKPAPDPDRDSVSPSPSASPVTGPYVALGDSYTSGLRIPPQGGSPQGCGRSGVNYPALVAQQLGLKDFTDVSCSGARTSDLTTAQQTDKGVNPAQLDAIGASTRLVTVGIGGNDAGFMDVLGRCAIENLRNSFSGQSSEAPCRSYYTTGTGRGEVQRKLDAAGARLGSALEQIKQRAPQARVLLVGYPALLPQDPTRCAETLGDGIATADVGFVAQQEQQLNAMLRQRAETAGVAFVDTYAAFDGHDMCAGEGERWIEPLGAAPGLAPIHPNARGEQGMAAVVLAALGQH